VNCSFLPTAWHHDSVTEPASYQALAGQHGTPLFVYNSLALTDALHDLRAALDPGVTVLHSLTANPNISLVGLLAGHGAGAAVSSLGELRTAVLADVDPGEIIFRSPSKGRAELHACVASRVYAVVAESFDELAELDRIARAQAVRQRVLLRINPRSSGRSDRPASTHAFGQFGLDPAQLVPAAPLPDRFPALDIAGVQVGPGRQVLDPDLVVDSTARSLELAERVAGPTQLRLDAVHVDGVLGAGCSGGGAGPDLARLPHGLGEVVRAFRARHPRTRLLFEAGGHLTARAGVYIVRVRHVRESLGQWFAVVDGGTHQHLAGPATPPARWKLPVRLLNRPVTGPAGSWHLTCPLCTPDDTPLGDLTLPPLRPGDLLGFERCGASGPTVWPGLFLRHGLPAEVLVHRGEAYLIRDRDEPFDLLRKQHHHRLRSHHLDRAQVIAQIRAATAQLLGRELPALREGTRLTELGLDSTGVLEMLMGLERQASFEVDADELDPVVFDTVGSLADYVLRMRRDR
jgi:diaminopimelate decarboxylase